jgi:tetratricopeptide (TPR) repeat protein
VPASGFVRCLSCGRRVSLADPRCPVHGAAGLPPADDEVTSIEIPSPRFRGYRVLHLIGRGGFGAVYAAQPEAGGEQGRVAIKLARADRPDGALRLVHEIAVLTDVGPPHVPAVFGSGELASGAPYVVLEYVDAPTLADRLVAGPMSASEAVSAAVAVLRALEVVHARGWVHRDLKPENVFFDPERGAKIADFGLVAGAARRVDLTDGDGVVGTAEYMAPEQCERAAEVDARADVYAMGVILHEMLAGAPPFWGAAAAVQQAHLGRRPPRLPPGAAPRELEEIVRRCLAKDRQDRFPSAAALRAALEQLTEAEPSVRSGRAPTPLPPMRSAPREERRAVSLLFFETDADVLSLQRRAAVHGGELGHASAGRMVLVYGHHLGDNPARPALRAAHDLIRGGIAARVRLDVAPVAVQVRAGGARRYLSPLFGRAERYPSSDDPPGVSVTPAAAAVLSAPADSVRPPPHPALGDLPTQLEAEPDDDADALLGRDAMIESLLSGARRAVADAVPTVAVVTGPPGHGKSHLSRALRKRLRALDVPAEILEIAGHEPSLGGAEQTMRELLQRVLDLPAEPPPEGAGPYLRERLAPCGAADAAPAVAIALGWMAVHEPGPILESGLRTLTAAPGALRSALTTAAGEALRHRALERRLIVLVDDAHHVDEATLAALEYAALAEARVPLWICALGRTAFAEEHASWGERAGRREAHELGPLDADSAAALCRRLLLPADNVPDDAVARLVERTRAVPLLLVELLRGLRREGLVRKRPRGDAWDLATDEIDRVPDLPLVEWLARRELDALPEALAAHARLLALLGEEVSIPDVAGVLARLDERGGDTELPLDAGVATRRLIAAGLLVEDGRGRVGFRHALVREEIAEGVPEALRRRIHEAAAIHFAGGGDDERRLAQRAFHAARAGLAAEAEAAYLTLAERMRARHAYLPAERCYSRALDQGGAASGRARDASLDPAAPGGALRRLAAHRGRGLMRYRIGRYTDALDDLRTARALAHDLGDVAAEIEILLDEATALDWMDEYKSSEALVEAARALVPRAPSPLLEARVLLGVGRAAHRFSREEDAARLIEEAADRAAALGDEGYETLVIARLMLGFIYPGLGRLADAERALDQAIGLCEEHGDQVHLAAAINNRALLLGCQGDRARMIADMERGVALARALGHDSLELIARFNLGEYLYLMDELDAAEPHVRRALQIERRLRGDGVRAVVAMLDARLRYTRGDEAGARAVVAEVRARQEAERAAGHTDALMVPSEDVMCAAVDQATRSPDAAAWDALEARSAQYSVGQEHIEVLELRAVAAIRRGDAREALAVLARARAAADRIPNVMGARLRRRLDEAQRLVS